MCDEKGRTNGVEAVGGDEGSESLMILIPVGVSLGKWNSREETGAWNKALCPPPLSLSLSWFSLMLSHGLWELSSVLCLYLSCGAGPFPSPQLWDFFPPIFHLHALVFHDSYWGVPLWKHDRNQHFSKIFWIYFIPVSLDIWFPNLVPNM